jgi:hypothetical protein
MRLRWQRRVRKQLRRMRGQHRTLAMAVAQLERGGTLLAGALRAIMLDPAHFHQHRAASAKLLALAEGGQAVCWDFSLSKLRRMISTRRRARIYDVTAAGKKQLTAEESRWQSGTSAVNRVLRMA